LLSERNAEQSNPEEKKYLGCGAKYGMSLPLNIDIQAQRSCMVQVTMKAFQLTKKNAQKLTARPDSLR